LPPPILPNDGVFYKWSNESIWPDGLVPGEGEDVHITSDMSVLLDVNPPPIGILTIDGNLAINSNQNYTNLIARAIYVRYGNFTAGTFAEAFTNKINITLLGVKNEPFLIAEPSITASNKVIYVAGQLKLYGVTPATTQTRLGAIANIGDTQITVLDLEGWKVGDEIAISPTEFSVDH
jgi:hypothetical protein